MEELKLVGWTYFDNEYPTEKSNTEQMNKIVDLIKEDIAKNNYVFSGQEHQFSPCGAPVFSNGTCFRASMRCWGSIMADVYEHPDGTPFSYMDFYMPLEESNMPDCSDFDVEPAVLDAEHISPGCTLKQDRQIIQEAISMGMPFLTTDKVLKEKYELMKNEQNNK